MRMQVDAHRLHKGVYFRAALAVTSAIRFGSSTASCGTSLALLHVEEETPCHVGLQGFRTGDMPAADICA
jgi:hypothetical protein